MAIASGTRIGPYEVAAQIGAGGMGEVYRAIDTNLGRVVAIKVVPEEFADDPERVARFEREARTLAALNHPNIATIYGLERSEGLYALVMELVEGQALSDRIAKEPVPIHEALHIAKQIAGALEAAHEQGIVHRDLKPSNILVRSDNTAKVLDFGLAKLTKTPVTGASHFATVGSPATLTEFGMLLGTAAYMSPEQARGQPVDNRADIWSFGCILYEMLTAKRCFEGKGLAETLASVMAKDPDWSAVPPNTPASITTLLRRALEKDPRKRVRDISIALFALEEADAQVLSPPEQPRTAQKSTHWIYMAAYGAAGLIAGIGLALAAWFLVREDVPRVSRFAIPTSAASALSIDGNDRDLAITRDGARLVYVGNEGTELFSRSFDALEPVSLFKGEPRAPFVSPDGAWVGFFSGRFDLMKMAVTGGGALTVARLDGGSRGATWTPNDTIVFATSSFATGLQEIPAAGGPIKVLTSPRSRAWRS